MKYRTMAKPNQLSFVAPPEVRTRLEQLSAESGRAVSALIREAVVQYLGPLPGSMTAEGLWSILRDPANWQTFKQIAIEMEGTAEPVKPVSVEAAPPQPSWRFRRGDGVAGRNNQPPPDEDIEPPF